MLRTAISKKKIEVDLWREYIETDSTPLQSMIFVSAISQLWIFGLYELLRTWLDWVSKLIEHRKRFEREAQVLEHRAGRVVRVEKQNDEVQEAENLNDHFYTESFRGVENDPSYVNELRYARDLVRPVSRKIELVRVTLAKHEIPKAKGKRAFAPGYARIDSATQSLCWIVRLKDGTEDLISRRRTADMCRRLLKKKLGIVDLFDLMKEKDVKLVEEKHYFRELPEGIACPDVHPYIAYLKEKNPEALWDRYIPSAVALERNNKLLEQLAKIAPKILKTLTPLEFPAGTWVYNATWEDEWKNEEDEVKQKLTPPDQR